MVDETFLRTFFLAGIVFLVSLPVGWCRKRGCPLRAIPTVGFSDPILSYLSSLRYNFDGIRMLREGYEKTKLGLFQIATLRTWMVLPTSPELIEDVRKTPDDVLCPRRGAEELIQPDYTLNFLNKHDHYHSYIILSQLTRIASTTFEDISDELVLALEDNIPTAGKGWVTVPALETIQRVICRVTNRVFVGVPLCVRNRNYQALNLNFAINVLKSATIIRFFPNPLKPLLTRIIFDLPSQVQREMEFIRPMFEEHLAKMEELGDVNWDDGPNDMLMWLMSESKGVERSLEGVARRMPAVNFAAIHTTSLTLTQALYRLLANPGYVEPLRREVEAVVAEYGWTTAGMDKMYNVHSFLRETQRVDGLGIYEEIYPNPDGFDGFRFARLRESSEGSVASRYQVGITLPAHLPFGHGRHACPRWFFAVTELKVMLARIVITYDFKLEGKEIPRIASSRIPRNANV
ncbi:cytochrome P450 [Lactarius psammicola]|nr:cytochrome P450 [Lactarius psammicola]